MWASVLNVLKPSTIAEIGVWKGDFAAAILEQCKSITEYVMIDPWAQLPDWNKPFNVKPEKFEDIYNIAMEQTAFASHRRKVLRGRTKEVIGEIEDKSLDFAYVDGDHTLRGITIDLITTLPKIKEGGYLAGDDFSNSPWQHAGEFEPTLVCPFAIYFAEAMNLPIRALPFNQFIITNDSKAGFSFVDPSGRYKDLGLNKK